MWENFVQLMCSIWAAIKGLPWGQIFLAFIVGIVSAILATPAAAYLLEKVRRRFDEERADAVAFLKGNWFSAYENQEKSGEDWTREELTIEFKSAKFTFKTEKREDGNYWHGEGDVLNGEILIGTWKDTLSPRQKGGFQLKITADGSLVGTVNGPTSKSDMKYGGWVLSKTEARLNKEIEAFSAE